MNPFEIKVGDRIKFRAVTRWSGATASRIVNGLYLGRPTVRFGGFASFIVRSDEVLSVEPAQATRNAA